jgi:excinuclease ABC subunit C
VEHKRDRAYCFIKVTREAAPRLLAVPEVSGDGAQYFGPYRGGEQARNTLREARDLLQLRDCRAGTRMRFADQLDIFAIEHTPLCLRADVKKCLAPCAGRCTRLEYATRVEQARRFLEGDAEHALGILQERLEAAVTQLRFEYAAALRDRLHRLSEAAYELRALRGTIDNLSFVYSVPGVAGDDRVYIIRRGTIRAERPAPRTAEERAELRTEARRLLTGAEYHTGRVLPEQAAEILLLARWFRLHPDERARAWHPDPPLPVANTG